MAANRNTIDPAVMLGKRLLYILRYGANREGLEVDEYGFVNLDELMTLELLQHNSKEEVLKVINESLSKETAKPRFNINVQSGITFVRAAYRRCLEKSAYHPGTKVFTLQEASINFVMNNLDEFDLEDFPEEEIIRTMIRRLKMGKRLNSKALKALLVPTITRLDMEGIYLTKSTLKCIWSQCPHLRAISLQDCGYIITDPVLTQLVKNLPSLERINLCGCNHLTPKCLYALGKHLQNLKMLHIGRGPKLSFQAVLDLIVTLNNLTFVDVHSLRTSVGEYHTLLEAAAQKGLKLNLRKPWELRKSSAEEENEGLDENWEDGNGAIVE